MFMKSLTKAVLEEVLVKGFGVVLDEIGLKKEELVKRVNEKWSERSATHAADLVKGQPAAASSLKRRRARKKAVVVAKKGKAKKKRKMSVAVASKKFDIKDYCVDVEEIPDLLLAMETAKAGPETKYSRSTI